MLAFKHHHRALGASVLLLFFQKVVVSLDIGLALAGGNIRAASSCYGIIRGLEQKKVIEPSTGDDVSAMKLIEYNSAISGGSIPAVLYTYAQVSTSQLLETDRDTDPSNITKELLSEMPKTSMGYTLAKKPDFNTRLIGVVLGILIRPLNIFRYNSLWTYLVNKKFFESLKVPRNKLFTSSKEELKNILEDNPKLKESDFILPRDDVKTLPMILVSMCGGRADFNAYEKKGREIHAEVWKKLNSEERTSSSINDLVLSIRDKYGSNLPMPYIITPDFVENMYHGTVQIRNKQIEFPEKIVKPFEWGAKKARFGSKKRLSVEHTTSMSTNFFGTAQTTLSLFVTALRTIRLSDGTKQTLRFADGGANDLFSIIPLVKQGTKDIISVYNFNQNPPHTVFNNTYADIYRVANATSIDDEDFELHFQNWLKHMNPRFTCHFGHLNTDPIFQFNIMNHIFHDPNVDRLKELMIKFNSLFKAGQPLIATLKDLEVIDNPFWGVKGGKKVNLTLIYFNMPKKFSENVSEDAVPPPVGMPKTDVDGRFTNEEFKLIPELPVEDPLAPLEYTQKQINMMGYLGSWMVHHSWDGLKGHDGSVVFEGFKNIFEKKKM